MRDGCGAMTRRPITAVAIVMLFAAATAYAAVTPIPPDQWPPGCDPDGLALQGDAADDTMIGTPQRDLLRGGGAEHINHIEGWGDRNCLYGGKDKDEIAGNYGADRILGGKDNDLITGDAGEDTINGGHGSDFIGGDAQGDSIHGGGGGEQITGGGGADEIEGEGGLDYLFGGSGRDEIAGEGGADVIKGGRGDGHLFGGRHSDRIEDTFGRNRISCGRGYDGVTTNRQSKVGRGCEKVTRR
jgi:Ca2+-binding RTX toxin-like protein